MWFSDSTIEALQRAAAEADEDARNRESLAETAEREAAERIAAAEARRAEARQLHRRVTELRILLAVARYADTPDGMGMAMGRTRLNLDGAEPDAVLALSGERLPDTSTALPPGATVATSGPGPTQEWPAVPPAEPACECPSGAQQHLSCPVHRGADRFPPLGTWVKVTINGGDTIYGTLAGVGQDSIMLQRADGVYTRLRLDCVADIASAPDDPNPQNAAQGVQALTGLAAGQQSPSGPPPPPGAPGAGPADPPGVREAVDPPPGSAITPQDGTPAAEQPMGPQIAGDGNGGTQ